jgi:predicted kinase
MPTQPSARSIKIDQDERGGWSSDRPRRDGAPPRPANLAVRCRVLTPVDQLRYSPGSLLLIVSPVAGEADRFAQRLIEDRGALLSLDKVRTLLAGRVDEDQVEAKGAELLDAAVAKRIAAGESVALVTESIGAEEREHYVRMAAEHKRPCHLILIETTREDVEESERPALNKLRKTLDAGGLGAEGFNTALRLGAGSIGEVKRVVFRPAPKVD